MPSTSHLTGFTQWLAVSLYQLEQPSSRSLHLIGRVWGSSVVCGRANALPLFSHRVLAPRVSLMTETVIDFEIEAYVHRQSTPCTHGRGPNRSGYTRPLS